MFKDNLFDKVHFIQRNAVPLDFDYNAYRPVTAAEVEWAGEATRLLPATAAHDASIQIPRASQR